jgi:hypothetical protein
MAKGKLAVLKNQRPTARAFRLSCLFLLFPARGSTRDLCADPSSGIPADYPYPDGLYALDTQHALNDAYGPRTCSPTEMPALPSNGTCFDYVPPNGALLPAFSNQPQGWSPDGAACGDAFVNVFDMQPLDPLAVPPCAPAPEALFKTSSPGSYTNSSGPSSPHMSPYTPTTLETLHIPTDAWQAQTSFRYSTWSLRSSLSRVSALLVGHRTGLVG